jgi:hypothetical protein
MIADCEFQLSCLHKQNIYTYFLFPYSGRHQKSGLSYSMYYHWNFLRRNWLNWYEFQYYFLYISYPITLKVSAPAFVAQIDWIDNVWPAELFIRQNNLLDKSTWARDHDFSTYPKVQR